MILIEKPKLKFLLAGRQIEVQASREHPKGRVYAVGVRRKRSICHAVIVNSVETADGWTLTIRQQTVDRAVYLAANPGAIRADYTTNPARAARELDGSPIEVAGDAWLANQAKVASDRDDELRRHAAHRRRLERRSTSDSRVKWSVAPPASDIQAEVPVGFVTTPPLTREAAA